MRVEGVEKAEKVEEVEWENGRMGEWESLIVPLLGGVRDGFQLKDIRNPPDMYPEENLPMGRHAGGCF